MPSFNQQEENELINEKRIANEIDEANQLEEQLTAPKEPSAADQYADLLNKYQNIKASTSKPIVNQPTEQVSDIDKAIAERDRRQMLGNMLQSFQKFTQAGVNVIDPRYESDTTVAQNIYKSGQDPINDYKMKVQQERDKSSDSRDVEKHNLVMQEYRQKLDSGNLDLMNTQKLSDPNSDESKMAQEFVLRMDPKLNAEVVKKQNASTLFKLSPMMQKLIVDKLKSEKNNSQITNIQDADGVVRTYMVDKSTGAMRPLGQTGYAQAIMNDKITGLPTKVSKSDINSPAVNISLPSQRTLEQNKSETKPEDVKPTNYDYADFARQAPNQAAIFQKIQKDMMSDMKDSREVATSITNLKSKLKTGGAWGDSVDSGLLGGIQTQAAKMAGQKGVLTDQDLVKFAGAGGVKAAIERIFSNPQGKMSDSDVEFFKKFSELMGKSLNEDISNRSKAFVQQAQQNAQVIHPDIDEKNIQKWMGVENIAPSVQNKTDMVKIRTPDGKIGSIPKSNLEKALSRGAVEVK